MNGVSPRRPSFSRDDLDGEGRSCGPARAARRPARGAGAAGARGARGRGLAEAPGDVDVERHPVGLALERGYLLLEGGVARLPHAAAGPAPSTSRSGPSHTRARAPGGGVLGRLAAHREGPQTRPPTSPSPAKPPSTRRPSPRAMALGPDRERALAAEAPDPRACRRGGRGDPGAALDEALVVDAGEKARARPAGVDLKGGATIGVVGPGRRPRRPSRRGGRAAVVAATYSGPLRRPSILRTRCRGAQIGNEGARLEVLRGEQVGAVAEIAQDAVDDELVGEAASLGAGAAVGAPAADASLVRHCPEYATQSAPCTKTSARRGLPADGRDVVERELAREDDAVAPSERASSHGAASVQVICVEAWMGRSGARARTRRDHAEILHDDRVGAGGGAGAHPASRRGARRRRRGC